MKKHKTIKFLGLVFALCLIPTYAFASIEELYNATCRIRVVSDQGQVAMGTGVVFKEDKEDYFILTAGHVVTKPDNVTGFEKVSVEFFWNGKVSQGFDATVSKRLYKPATIDDLALIKLPKTAVKGKPIQVMGLHATGYKYIKDKTIITIGCPLGGWATMFYGTLRDSSLGKGFFPVPHAGRSGSALYDKKTEKIIGIVILQDTEIGIVVPLAKMYDFLFLDD